MPCPSKTEGQEANSGGCLAAATSKAVVQQRPQRVSLAKLICANVLVRNRPCLDVKDDELAILTADKQLLVAREERGRDAVSKQTCEHQCARMDTADVLTCG